MQTFILNLKKLKKLGAIAVKQSLEDEGASFEDIKKMRTITLAAKLDLNVKKLESFCNKYQHENTGKVLSNRGGYHSNDLPLDNVCKVSITD